jgi:hypothetical protein
MLRKTILAGLSLLILLSLRTASTADAAANYVAVDMACSVGGGVDALLSWVGASTATPKYLDVSLHNNGWQVGTFASLNVAAPQSSIIASGLMPNAVYFVRVNQQMSGGLWDASPTFAFRTPPDCPLLLASPTLSITTTTTESGGGGATATPPSAGTGDNCHPAYYGACLRKDAVDYDCQGGGGDGPDFIRGPVYLSGGSDPFELDKDGDGIGCNE